MPRNKPGPKPIYSDAERSDANRQRNRDARRRETKAGQNIGVIPAVADPVRREACRESLELFCLTYLPQTFTLPFSDDHKTVIAKIEKAVIYGGLFAVAMPRGSGKTSLSEAACLWAILYGYRRFVVVIGSSAVAATEMLQSVQTELGTNELLIGDFPEALYPIQQLEGEPRRCKGQTFTTADGEVSHTHTKWGVSEVVLPTVRGSNASGAIIRVAGITGRVRGQKFKRPDGKSARPDFVIVDDPQTDASANSESQCRTRERTIAGAVLGLAGPGKKISGVMPLTVVRAGDVADRALNTKIHPEWNGSRYKLLYKFPPDMDKWREYRDVLLSFNPAIPGDKERAADAATEFYAANRGVMDEGAEIAWPARYESGELSALQNAMNLFFRDARAFAAEYQNEPMPEETESTSLLTVDQICAKVNNLRRGYAPVSVTRLTAGVDVQKNILFWCVVAWESNFTGYVIDYGTYPDQGRPYFTLSQVDRTIAKATGVAGLEAQLFAGITNMLGQLCGRDYEHGQGGRVRVERCIVDAGYETDTVFAAVRSSPFAAIAMPAHGRGIGAANAPMSAWAAKPGERRGLNWVVPVTAKRDIRGLVFETNFWSDFIFQRLGTPAGGAGCLSLWGEDATQHSMFADHLGAEAFVVVEARGRRVNEWSCKPNRDNHYFDALRMATVAASMQGAELHGIHAGAAPQRIKLSDLQRQKARR